MTEEKDRTAEEAEKQAPTQPAGGEQEQESDKQTPTAPPDANPEDQEDGRTPPPDDLSEDPAYEPEDEGLKDIKGG
jgi:hypothetical protein